MARKNNGLTNGIDKLLNATNGKSRVVAALTLLLTLGAGMIWNRCDVGETATTVSHLRGRVSDLTDDVQTLESIRNVKPEIEMAIERAIERGIRAGIKAARVAVVQDTTDQVLEILRRRDLIQAPAP